MQATVRNNYYEILELPANAPQHEVTTAYDRARNTYSGDNPAIYTIFSEHEARELMALIEEAYSVLGNKTLRSIYDQRLLSGVAKASELTYEALVQASKQLFPESREPERKIAYKKDEAFEKEIAAREHWDGDFLKKVREYKNISTSQMHDITKINPYYITAIEANDPKNLPARVFVRGYIVQLAKALGLDDRKVADSYMKFFKG